MPWGGVNYGVNFHIWVSYSFNTTLWPRYIIIEQQYMYKTFFYLPPTFAQYCTSTLKHTAWHILKPGLYVSMKINATWPTWLIERFGHWVHNHLKWMNECQWFLCPCGPNSVTLTCRVPKTLSCLNLPTSSQMTHNFCHRPTESPCTGVFT